MSTSNRKPLLFVLQLASIQALDESEAIDIGAPTPQYNTPIDEHILYRQTISTYIKNQRYVSKKKKTITFKEFDSTQRPSNLVRIKQHVLYSDNKETNTKLRAFI